MKAEIGHHPVEKKSKDRKNILDFVFCTVVS
jgi:hypothetical protein